MLYRELTPTGVRGALIGFVEGALGVGVVLIGWTMFTGNAPGSTDVPIFSGLSLVGGLVLALGRGISGRMLGAGAGCVLGILLGLPLAFVLPTSWDIEQSSTESTQARAFALAGPTLDGKTIDLTDYRGKIVLVDFWATWCGPCVEELPNVRKTYDRYHDQGFEVIAVSLDNERAKLKDFVERDKLPWPQIIFDKPHQMGWSSPLVQQHHIKGIPATFLIDREGKVLVADLRGGELIAEVGRHIDPATNGKPRYGRTATRVIPIRLYVGGGGMLLLGALLGALIQRRAMA